METVSAALILSPGRIRTRCLHTHGWHLFCRYIVKCPDPLPLLKGAARWVSFTMSGEDTGVRLLVEQVWHPAGEVQLQPPSPAYPSVKAAHHET